MDSERSELETFFGAVRFFTRLPVPGSIGADVNVLERAIRYFPAVGLIVGLIAGFTFAITSFFWPKTLAILAAMAIAIYVTGAIHEDGWNDTVDGFGGGWDKERILAIMRDSCVGSFGAVALVMLLLTRFFALVEVDILLVPFALIGGHAVSRFCSTCVLWRLDYVRPEGKAKPFSNQLSLSDMGLAAACALVPVLFLPPSQFIPGLILAALATLWLARLFKSRIGGYTGDCLGAVQQFSEVAFYCGLLCKFS
ncbi:adenosylcobinamide-GDP ribazoletransferase [Propionivibrio limicola]|uniref:adenosylcobinamide-GDP ribazoletransferase n=1 Tax=Propionivibrio limicola TaxID=167645 RepID=UPI001290E361|nr:adenosylcobinamide-GDP ribazoletransferase [Propionivibrio limicola]